MDAPGASHVISARIRSGLMRLTRPRGEAGRVGCRLLVWGRTALGGLRLSRTHSLAVSRVGGLALSRTPFSSISRVRGLAYRALPPLPSRESGASPTAHSLLFLPSRESGASPTAHSLLFLPSREARDRPGRGQASRRVRNGWDAALT
ncbi:hypothetical protein CDD83_6852 [Cordyceps sp. RAO-2017]|nr:hypothetical protein CDD83_6852 [Cordyceps sp. RAO-2017]